MGNPGSPYRLPRLAPWTHVPSVVGTAPPELVFTATTDAAQWGQIYGLLRPTDVNDIYITTLMSHIYPLQMICLPTRYLPYHIQCYLPVYQLQKHFQ